jgi:hypothetical protein
MAQEWVSFKPGVAMINLEMLAAIVIDGLTLKGMLPSGQTLILNTYQSDAEAKAEFERLSEALRK